MATVPMGKVLLRNVIRHTDAHNKIQEESEMWKLRGMEMQSSSAHAFKPRWMNSSHLERSSMHCDRYMDDSEGSARDRLGEKSCLSKRDEREARYWTRKLYEFEANDPDRWGHSGFKELYPEEFQTDGETGCTKRRRKNAKQKMSSDKQKNPKKSSKRKKKKKKRQRTAGSDSESDSSDTDSVKKKQKRKSGKSKHSRKKKHKRKVKEEDSSTEDSESDRRGEITRRKRHRTAADSQKEPERKKRKNWKANEQKSEESTED